MDTFLFFNQGYTLSHSSRHLHRNRNRLLFQRRMNMKRHITNFIIIDLYIFFLFQHLFQHAGNLKFTVK